MAPKTTIAAGTEQFRATVDTLGHLPAEHVAGLPAAKRDALLAAFRRQRGRSV